MREEKGACRFTPPRHGGCTFWVPTGQLVELETDAAEPRGTLLLRKLSPGFEPLRGR